MKDLRIDVSELKVSERLYLLAEFVEKSNGEDHFNWGHWFRGPRAPAGAYLGLVPATEQEWCGSTACVAGLAASCFKGIGLRIVMDEGWPAGVDYADDVQSLEDHEAFGAAMGITEGEAAVICYPTVGDHGWHRRYYGVPDYWTEPPLNDDSEGTAEVAARRLRIVAAHYEAMGQ